MSPPDLSAVLTFDCKQMLKCVRGRWTAPPLTSFLHLLLISHLRFPLVRGEPGLQWLWLYCEAWWESTLWPSADLNTPYSTPLKFYLTQVWPKFSHNGSCYKCHYKLTSNLSFTGRHIISSLPRARPCCKRSLWFIETLLLGEAICCSVLLTLQVLIKVIDSLAEALVSFICWSAQRRKTKK